MLKIKKLEGVVFSDQNGYEVRPTRQKVTVLNHELCTVHGKLIGELKKFLYRKTDLACVPIGTTQSVTLKFSSRCSPGLTDVQHMECESFVKSLGQNAGYILENVLFDGTYSCILKKR